MELTANQMGDIIFQAFFLNTASRSGNEELFYLLSTCIKTEKITANNSIFNISYLSYAKMFLNFDDLEKVYPEICLFFPENANSDISYDDNYKAKIIKSIEEGYLTEPRQGYIWVGTGEDNASIYVKEFIGGYPRLIIRNELERSFIEEFNRKVKSIDISNFEIKKERINCVQKYFQRLASERTFYAYDHITQRVRGIDNPYKAFRAYAKGEYSKLFIGCENYSKLKEPIVTKEDKDFLSEYENKTWADLYKKNGLIIDLALSETIKTESLIKYGLETMILFLTSIYENPKYFWKKNYLNVLSGNKLPKDEYCFEQADFRNYEKALFISDKVSQSNFLGSPAPNSLDELKPNLSITWIHTPKISNKSLEEMAEELDNDDKYSTGMPLKIGDYSCLKVYARKILSLIKTSSIDNSKIKSDFIKKIKEKGIYNVESFFNGHYSLDILIDELTTSEYISIIKYGERTNLEIFDSEDDKNEVINLIKNFESENEGNSIYKKLDNKDGDDEGLSLSDILGNDSGLLTDFVELKEEEKVAINTMQIFNFLKTEIEKYFIFDENFKDYLINYFQNLAFRYLYKDENSHDAVIKYHELTESDIKENFDIWKPELKKIIRKIIKDYKNNIIKEDLLFEFTGVSYEQYQKFADEYKNKHVDTVNSYVKGTVIPLGHKEAGDDALKRERIISKSAFEEFYNKKFSNGECFRNLDLIVNYAVSEKDSNGKKKIRTPYKEYFEDIVNRLNKLFLSWRRVLKPHLRAIWKKYSKENEPISFLSQFDKGKPFDSKDGVFNNLRLIKLDEVLDSKIDDFTYQKLVFQVGFGIISSRTENRKTSANELWNTFYTKRYLDVTKMIKAYKPEDSEITEKYIDLQAYNGFYNRTEFNNIFNLIYDNLSKLTEGKTEFYLQEDLVLRSNMEESFKLFFNNENSGDDDKKFYKFINDNYLSKLYNKSMALSLFDMLEEKNRSFYFLIVNKPCNTSSSSFEIQNEAYIDTLERVKEEFIERSE